MNWDTNELLNWLMNDEGLYRDMLRISSKYHDKEHIDIMQKDIKSYILEMESTLINMGCDIDFFEIDFIQLTEFIYEHFDQ